MVPKYTLAQYRNDSFNGIDFDMLNIQSEHVNNLLWVTPHLETRWQRSRIVIYIEKYKLRSSQKKFMAKAAYLGRSHGYATRKLKEAEDLAAKEIYARDHRKE